MKYRSIVSTIIAPLLFLSLANAQEVSREEFESLLKRVEALEHKLAVKQKSDIEAIATEVVSGTNTEESTSSDSTIIGSVISEIHSREEAINHPWMDADKWAQIKKGMALETVIEILGPPYTNEPSLRKRIDKVFTYQGRRTATNEKVKGVIRFYKDEVVNVEKPKL